MLANILRVFFFLEFHAICRWKDHKVNLLIWYTKELYFIGNRIGNYRNIDDCDVNTKSQTIHKKNTLSYSFSLIDYLDICETANDITRLMCNDIVDHEYVIDWNFKCFHAFSFPFQSYILFLSEFKNNTIHDVSCVVKMRTPRIYSFMRIVVVSHVIWLYLV